jgi:hypothetical protein
MMQMQDVTQIVTRASADPAFSAELEKNPRAVFDRAGITLPAGLTIHVFKNDAKTFHAVLPMPEQGEVVDFVRKTNPLAAKVYERAWQDGAFKKRLMTEPRQAFVEATGVTPPASFKLIAHEDTPQVLNVVIPYATGQGELSDADLENVAGGKGSSCNSTTATVAETAGGIGVEIAAGGLESGGPLGLAIGVGIGAVGTGLAAAGAAIASLFK